MCNNDWETMSAYCLLPAPHRLMRMQIQINLFGAHSSNAHGRAAMSYSCCLSAGISWLCRAALCHLCLSLGPFFPPLDPPLDVGFHAWPWEWQLQECTCWTRFKAYRSHACWTVEVNNLCPKQVVSLGDLVIQLWLIQGLEERATASMERLNRTIGEDETGPYMKENNTCSLILILYPQWNIFIYLFFFPITMMQ